MQEADEPFAEVEEMSFDGDEPVIISWDKKDKEDVICGSSATVKVISERDGQYQHLYTIAPGDIRMDIYWNGEIYWTGCLDPEFYEEPYTLKENYVVTLTFSDFGILDRMKFDLTGTPCLMDYVTRALEVAKLNTQVTLNYEDVSSGVFYENKPGEILYLVNVRADNFTDEDGEVNTWQEALEAVLQPMALKIVQKEGRIYLFDINGLWEHAEYRINNPGDNETYSYPNTIAEDSKTRWESDDCELATDKVANSVTISFSPYSEDEIEQITMEHEGETDTEKMSGSPVERSRNGEDFYLSLGHISHNWQNNPDNDWEDTRVFFSKKGGNVKNDGTYFFRTMPINGTSSEETGIVSHLHLTVNDPTNNRGGTMLNWSVKGTGLSDSRLSYPQELTPIFTAPLVKMNTIDYENYWLNLKLDLRVSADGHNPWSDGDNEDNTKKLSESIVTMFIPTKVEIVNEDGVAVMHFTNEKTAKQRHVSFATGLWKTGPAEDIENICWLQYYDKNKLQGCDIVGRWMTNRQCIGTILGFSFEIDGIIGTLTEYEKMLDDGEFIPYPSLRDQSIKNGSIYLRVTVLEGMYAYQQILRKAMASETIFREERRMNKDVYRLTSWMLFKDLKIELRNKSTPNKSTKADDVDYVGTVNAAAKDDVKIDTMCGVLTTENPFAKGCYIKTPENTMMKTIKRAGKDDIPERLLIRTLTAQYNNRHKTFKGTMKILIRKESARRTLQVYKFGWAFSTKNPMAFYLAVEEEQNLADETAEVTLCEISPDREVEY